MTPDSSRPHDVTDLLLATGVLGELVAKTALPRNTPPLDDVRVEAMMHQSWLVLMFMAYGESCLPGIDHSGFPPKPEFRRTVKMDVTGRVEAYVPRRGDASRYEKKDLPPDAVRDGVLRRVRALLLRPEPATTVFGKIRVALSAWGRTWRAFTMPKVFGTIDVVDQILEQYRAWEKENPPKSQCGGVCVTRMMSFEEFLRKYHRDISRNTQAVHYLLDQSGVLP